VVVVSVRLRFVRKEERRRYNVFVEKMRTDTFLLQANGTRPLVNKEIAKSSPRAPKDVENGGASIMPKETEERLLNELEKLEEDEFFTNKDVSLSTLTGKLQTNTKYLSYIINAHKGKDFSNYIHGLRIGFAVDKLQNDPKYLSYKLAHLAEECGYSSHSKFAM